MDINRRKFLKIMLIGSGTLLLGRVLSPLFSKFFDDFFAKSSPGPFQVVENNKKLSIYDNSGEEIFQIDNGA